MLLKSIFNLFTQKFYLLCFSVRLSHLTPRELKDAGFNIQERGQIEVKGKGPMTTYFLLGNPLVSEDSIMGRAARGICLYKEDVHGQSRKGKEENMENYLYSEEISLHMWHNNWGTCSFYLGKTKRINVNKNSKGKLQQPNMVGMVAHFLTVLHNIQILHSQIIEFFYLGWYFTNFFWVENYIVL